MLGIRTCAVEEYWLNLSRRFFHRTPLLSFNHFSDGKHSSLFDSTQNPQLNRPLSLLTGRGLGGATRINGGQYTCGVPGQFAHWTDLADNAGWSFSELKPYLNRFETFVGAHAREYHGTEGPVTVRSFDGYFYGCSSKAFDAARAVGFPSIEDMHSPLAPSTGVNKMQFTINRDGTRSSSFRAYLPKDFVQQVSDRLHICTETIVRKLVLSESSNGKLTTTGVEIEPVCKGAIRIVSAKKEVILAAGALHSPKILLLSGIGPKDHLKSMDIPVLRDLPGVGMHLQDHLILPVSFYCPIEDSMWSMIRRPTMFIKQLYNYLRYGDGWFLGTLVEVEVFAPSDVIDDDGTPKPLDSQLLDANDPKNIPDICVMACPISDPMRPGSDKSRGFFGLHVALLHPKSTGTLSLASIDPHTPPRCELNCLTAPEDWDSLRKALKTSMCIAEEMRRGGYAVDNYDVPKSLEQPDLDDFIRERVETMYHYSSTCRMAGGSFGVVDGELCVHGTTNLRICDASVFPDSPGTHPQALVYAFAERCAEMVLARAKLEKA